MTGGSEKAARINRTLAEAAQEVGLAMCVGSQRAAIQDPSLAKTFQVRRFAPDILLFANLGAVQLNTGFGPEECLRAVEMVEADALVLHLNPLQEALQPEGNHDFLVYVEDWGDPGAALDMFWIDVSDDNDNLSLGPDTPNDWVLLDGGNIMVPHTPN